MVQRIYVEKKPEYAVEAEGLLAELQEALGLNGLTGLRILNRYDVEGISEELFRSAVINVFSEPPLDEVYDHVPEAGFRFAVAYLPGQFDQRADSAAACISLLSQGERPLVRSARVYLLEGVLSESERSRIAGYVVNPVESEVVSLDRFETLAADYPPPPDVAVLTDFCSLDEQGLNDFLADYALAMDDADICFCQNYFQTENRAPTLTEIRMIDTYWSDHCRHTTFGTELVDVKIHDAQVKKTFDLYLDLRKQLGREEKPLTMMDMATIGARALKAAGKLENLDESEEINACSVKVKVDVSGREEDWLLLFKNETHNHPTEIEPFGGAATCIGGAIRDPLSGRGYVYQAMRVTGAGNPLVPVSETLAGKLPQRKLTQTAAAGYSSYGNQIGLATGQVREFYHPGYVAKRMEIGAVVGAVPLANVRRETPEAGDVVILLGGRTGRDGCGGATGSSKAHKADSLEECGAEVQKGNAPVERKLQRLFRNPAASKLIRRCNDFGAGGVSVAIGELADGLDINLDMVPKKYDGLDGTELAISESQERMAVVVEEKDAAMMIRLADEENLEATIVATVTEEPRLVMQWRGKTIVDIRRDFLNSNGASKQASVEIEEKELRFSSLSGSLNEKLTAAMSDLNTCCQKGLAERFDATIGAGTVMMPFGGKHQLTPVQGMVAKLPVFGETTTVSGMAFGFDPYLSEQNPYAGAYQAVADSAAKLVAMGFSRKEMYLSFQEYFERLKDDPKRWGKPVSALMGALQAQMDLELAAIGGKDSMSGSFEDLDVPPTLVSFAVAAGKLDALVTPELKAAGEQLCLLMPQVIEDYSIGAMLDRLEAEIRSGNVTAAYVCGRSGVAAALCEMSFGNRIGVKLETAVDLFAPAFSQVVVACKERFDGAAFLGETVNEYNFTAGEESVDLTVVEAAYISKLEPVFPWRGEATCKTECVKEISFTTKAAPIVFKGVQPQVLIPVFPGTNCEFDSARAVERAGGRAKILVIRDLTPKAVAESAAALAKAVCESQIVMLPGGFSGGDEPEGSAKLITAFFRGAAVKEAVHELLDKRDGLMLGICNGFQALIKLGLLPFGEILEQKPEAPTLTFNTIGRHQSMMVQTKITSNLSPWLSFEPVGSKHSIAVSHGEGRFVADYATLRMLEQKGMIAAQYVDLEGKPTMDVRYNPNGSAWAIEAITSADGRILGKMGHTERSGDGLYQNIAGNRYQKLFEGGIGYFK